MSGVRRTLLIAILLVLGVPSAALAATAQITETVNSAGGREPLLSYAARPGELNAITMTRGPAYAQTTIRDDSVTITRTSNDFDVYALGGEGADTITGGGHFAGGPGNDVLTSTSPTAEVCDKSCSS